LNCQKACLSLPYGMIMTWKRPFFGNGFVGKW
jgi:hypothetical protein